VHPPFPPRSMLALWRTATGVNADRPIVPLVPTPGACAG
jgi:hypothetical protein